MTKHTRQTALIATALLTSVLSLQPTAQAASADFVGTWVNATPTTNGITRINITQNADKTLSIQVFGRCHPSDCDWGKANVVTYGTNVSDTNHMYASAVYNQGFSNKTMVISMLGKQIMVQTLTQFTDGSGRQHYYSRETFTKYR